MQNPTMSMHNQGIPIFFYISSNLHDGNSSLLRVLHFVPTFHSFFMYNIVTPSTCLLQPQTMICRIQLQVEHHL